MQSLREAARVFLALERIVVAGVSRQGNLPANAIYKKLRDSGHHVFAVNPKTPEVEGERCYPTLRELPEPVDAVVIATPPSAAPQLVRECADLGIRNVWMHRSIGTGSVNDEAVRLCRELGINVIAGSCPMMFCEPVDPAHKCLRWFLHITGKEAPVSSAP